MGKKENKNDVICKTTVKNGGSEMKNGKFYYDWFTDYKIYLVDKTNKIDSIVEYIKQHEPDIIIKNDIAGQEGLSCGINFNFNFINNKVTITLITIKEMEELESEGKITGSLMKFSDEKEYRIRDRLKWIKYIMQAAS